MLQIWINGYLEFDNLVIFRLQSFFHNFSILYMQLYQLRRPTSNSEMWENFSFDNRSDYVKREWFCDRVFLSEGMFDEWERELSLRRGWAFESERTAEEKYWSRVPDRHQPNLHNVVGRTTGIRFIGKYRAWVCISKGIQELIFIRYSELFFFLRFDTYLVKSNDSANLGATFEILR